MASMSVKGGYRPDASTPYATRPQSWLVRSGSARLETSGQNRMTCRNLCGETSWSRHRRTALPTMSSGQAHRYHVLFWVQARFRLRWTTDQFLVMRSRNAAIESHALMALKWLDRRCSLRSVSLYCSGCDQRPCKVCIECEPEKIANCRRERA